jgi:PKHD-type hydroxylase
MILVPKLHTPLEPYIIWENGFTQEEIDKIVALGELRNFSKGTIGGSDVGDEVSDLKIRDTDLAWIEQDADSEWLIQRVQSVMAQVNHDKFQFDLEYLETFQYGKYKLNGHYTWHTDSGPNIPRHRKLSVVVGLSNPDDYEGGEFMININGNQDNCQTFKIRRGDMLLFPSYMPHKVAAVTKGERMTLVTWAVGPKFK